MNASRYHRHVAKAFAALRGERGVRERHPIGGLRMVIFSDHHRGDRTGADDFQRCEAVYRAALDRYFEDGYDLVLLGDVEELWETMPAQAVEAYADTLASERRFARAGRYRRIFGNHDDAWRDGKVAGRHLGDYICDDGGCNIVHEAVSIEVTENGDAHGKLGDIFLTHGHQGTLDSDRWAGLSRWLVRWIWRPIQRVLRVGSSTPSNDFGLRLKHEVAMHGWAAGQPGLILIAGHTHHPVFSSHSHESQLTTEIAALERERAGLDPQSPDGLTPRIEQKRSDLRALLAKTEGKMIDRPDDTRPCYFNAGCCSFSDGDITGMEVADGEIRLVRWKRDPGNEENATRSLLRHAGLRGLFDQLR